MTMSTVTNIDLFITVRGSFFPKEILDLPFARARFRRDHVKIPFTIELRYPRKKKKEGDVGSIQRYTSLIESTPRKGNPLEASSQGIRECGFIEEKISSRYNEIPIQFREYDLK